MNVNMFLFDDFDMLGAFGPAEIFSLVSGEFGINYWSLQGDIVNSCLLYTSPSPRDRG